MSANPQSIAALLSMSKERHTSKRTVAEAFRDMGESGLTCDEVEFLTGLKHQNASARVNELAREVKIIETGQTRRTSSGRAATVYAISQHGRDWLRGGA